MRKFTRIWWKHLRRTCTTKSGLTGLPASTQVTRPALRSLNEGRYAGLWIISIYKLKLAKGVGHTPPAPGPAGPECFQLRLHNRQHVVE